MCGVFPILIKLDSVCVISIYRVPQMNLAREDASCKSHLFRVDEVITNILLPVANSRP